MERKLPEGWEWKRIGDISKTTSGGTPSRERTNYYGGPIPWLKSGELKDNLITNYEETITKEGLANSSAKIIPKGTLLVAMYGATVGRVGILGFDSATNQAICAISPSEGVDTKFLFHYLIASRESLLSKRAGGAQPNISQEILRDFHVPVPSLDTQQRIVTILDKAEETKRLRAQANELTQKLLQSVFLEMFGDPVKNPMGWRVDILGNLISGKKSLSCGPFGSQLKIGEYVESGVPVLGIDNVETDRFVWAKPKYVTPEKAEQLTAFVTTPGDVLITRTGTVGRACVSPSMTNGAIIGPNLLKIKFDRTKILPEFFSAALSYIPSVMGQIVMISPGATVAVLNTTNLKALKMIIPDLSAQREYVRIVGEVKSMIIQQEESNKNLTNMNVTLALKAFTGELVA